MPGGVLYTALPQEGGTPRILALDLETKRHHVVTEGAFARFVPPSSLFFVRGQLESGSAQLFVATFDPKTRTLTGSAEVVAEGVGVSADGLAHYAVSNRDQLVYAPPVQSALRVVDGKGVVHATIPLKQAVDMINVSADGRRAVLALGSQLQIVDLERGVMERVTDQPGRYKFPNWSPDGRRILYRYQRPEGGPYQIMILDVGTGAEPEAVTEVNANPETGGASTWTPDGQAIAGNEHKPGQQDQDVWIMRLGADRRRAPLVAGPFVEVNARISPDGRTIAFISMESGGFDVFVRPFEGGARRRVSPGGGFDPIWHPNGRELFYRVGNRIFSAAILRSTGGIQAGTPRTVIDRPLRGGGLWQYGVLPDGRLLTMEEAEPVSTLRVLLNWRQMIEARQTRNSP
jgi:Tol biopolymer transport system component